MRYKLTDIQLAGNKQVKDANALLDLLNEHCRTNIAMTFSRARGGRANLKYARFTVPQHAFERGETYLQYYVIHEFTHCLGIANHGSRFKRKERELLDLFNIKIDYARAYPRALYANGERVYYKEPNRSIETLHEHIYSIMKVVDGKQLFYCHYCRKQKPIA